MYEKMQTHGQSRIPNKRVGPIKRTPSSVRPKPLFWFRHETETKKLAVTFGRYQN